MSKANILVVEDEALIAKDIKEILRSLGYNVMATVDNAKDAIRLAERKPDLILMDILIKGPLDGIEAAKRIHVQSNIPVVYLTAFADEARLERAKITEPFGYIIKPFEEKMLHSTIEMALYKHKSEKEKAALKEQITKLIRKINLTENEKFVLYGLIRYPMFNDVELSKKLRIKRSTVTAIKNKLYNDGYYFKHRLPNFALIGCELLTVIYGKINKIMPNREELQAIFAEILGAPEQIYLSSTDKEFMGLCVSKNLTDIKKHIDKIHNSMKEKNLPVSIDCVYFPFDTSDYMIFNYGPYVKKRLEVNLSEEKIGSVKGKKRRLTKNERVIFYALVRFGSLNDSEIALKTKLPRPSISQIKRRLINDGFIGTLNIPNLLKLKSELLVFNYGIFNDGRPKELGDFLKENAGNIFRVTSSNEACYMNVYDDYTEYESNAKEGVKFFSDKKLELKLESIMSVPLLAYESLDFASLLKKIFDLGVRF
jgi:CheY-like chemotaxis protein